ncbi:MAG: glycosyltransferase family 4 protein [archaeon]
MDKIKVLHILNTTDIGGAESLFLNICKYIDKRKYEFTVFSFQKGILEEEFKKLTEKKDLDDPAPFTLRSFRAMEIIIKKKKIDIIHAHLQKPELYGFLLKIKHPKIKFLIEKGNINDYRKKLFWRLANGLIIKAADKVVLTSKSIKEFTRKTEFAPEKKLEVIYGGVNLEEIDKKQKTIKRDHVRKKLGLGKKDKAIISVGRLVKEKGYDHLIKAVKELLKTDPNYKLLIVGDGYMKKELEEQIKKLRLNNHIDLLGERKDVVSLLKAADVYCASSVKEGLGVAAIEAMALEVPVVSTTAGGLPEVVGDTGILVKPGNSKQLARGIEDLFKRKDRKDLVKQARQRVEKNFSIKVAAKTYEKLYAHMLK